MTAARFTTAGLMHGHDYSGEECAGWLCQRKWDGHFALWDGERLRSREGLVIAAPDFFLAGLPDFPLCCELVASKEGANRTTSLVRTKNRPEWERARLYVFDAPQMGWDDVHSRVDEAAAKLQAGGGARFAEMTITFTLRDRAHLLTELRDVLDAGGEGLMISPPDHPYTAGRTRRLLKVKRQSLHFLKLNPDRP